MSRSTAIVPLSLALAAIPRAATQWLAETAANLSHF
jgi:hypothetical protein